MQPPFTSEETSCNNSKIACDEVWRSWCRLCAKDEPDANINIFMKNEDSLLDEPIETNSTQSALADTIKKYFLVDIKDDDCSSKMLCTGCFTLVTSMTNFMERVGKVQKMFEELHRRSSESDCNSIDSNAVRVKYGLHEAPGEIDVPRFRHTHFLEAKPKINELEEKIFDTSLVESEEYQMENPLEEEEGGDNLQEELPRLRMRIKKESMNDEENDECIDKDSSFQENDPFDTDEEFVPATHFSESSSSENENEEKIEVYSEKPDAERKSSKRRKKSPSHDSQLSEGNDRKRRTAAKPQDFITCSECPRKFLRRHHYYVHLKRAHGQEPPPVTKLSCPSCPRVFSTQYKLDVHSRIHLPDELKYVCPCPFCEKKFSSNPLVQTHIKYIHNNERPFICEECGIMFRTNVALKSHMLTHTDYAPFECELCKKKFKNQVRLKYHMEIHDPNKHICSECGLQLNSRATLNRHLLVHSDEMHHKCDYCQRAFKRAKALKNHLILHTGLKPYSCNFCDRTFANGSNCRSHKKKAHPNELAEWEARVQASGGEKQYTRNIPKLEALKAVTKAADNLTPVVSKQSGRFAFGKKPKQTATSPEGSVDQISTKALKKELEQGEDSLSTNKTQQSVETLGDPNEMSTSLLPASHSTVALNPCPAIPTIDNIYNHIMKQATLAAQNAQHETAELSQHTLSAPPTPTASPSVNLNLSHHLQHSVQHNLQQHAQSPLYSHLSKAPQRFLMGAHQSSETSIFNGQHKQEEDFITVQSPESRTSSHLNDEPSPDVSPARFYNNIRTSQHSAFL